MGAVRLALPLDEDGRNPLGATVIHLDACATIQEGYDFLRTVPFSWGGRRLARKRSSAFLSKDELVIRIGNIPGSWRPKEIYERLAERCESSLTLQDMWAEGFEGTDVFARVVYVACKLRLIDEERFYPVVDLPGHLSLYNQPVKLHYRGRYRHCTYCQSGDRPTHPTEKCKWRTCSIYSERGNHESRCVRLLEQEIFEAPFEDDPSSSATAL